MANRSDDFNRADSSSSLGTPSDGGSAWVAPGTSPGTFGISSNKGYKSADAASFQVAYLEASTTAVDVQATFSSIGSMGLSARVSDNQNFIMCQVFTGSAYLWKRVSGSFTQLGSTYTGAFADGDVIKLKADSSNAISLYQNGTLRVGPITDSHNSTQTKHGLMSYDITSRFDDFSITDLAGAAAASLIYYQPAIGPLLVR